MFKRSQLMINELESIRINKLKVIFNIMTNKLEKLQIDYNN